MPHGTPDWGQIPDVSGYALTEDLAELAARLGSICTFDRRGSIFFLDDFESGVGKWELENIGGDEAFEAFSGYGISGGYCGKLTSDATGDYFAKIMRYFAYPQLVKIGFEISFTCDANAYQFMWGFYGHGREEWLHARVWYSSTDEKLYYDPEGPGFPVLASDVELVKADYLFHTAKLVIDLKTGKYVRFILDDVEYDMSDFYYEVDPSAGDLQIYAYYKILTLGGTAPVSYVDNCIITRDES